MVTFQYFFKELSESLTKAILKYQTIIVMENFNIDLKIERFGFNKLDEFYDLFNLTNFINTETCFTKFNKFLIDLFLTNNNLFKKRTQLKQV